MDSVDETQAVKRRKLNHRKVQGRSRQEMPTPNDSWSSFSDPESDDPESDNPDIDFSEPELPPLPRSSDDIVESPEGPAQRHPRIHVPTRNVNDENIFVTQLTQPPSSPSRIRGPRWKKRIDPNEAPDFESDPEITTKVPDNVPDSSQKYRGQTGEGAAAVSEFDAILEQNPDFFSDDLEETVDNHSNGAGTESSAAASRDAPKAFRQTTLFGNSNPGSSGSQQRVHNWPLAGKKEAPTHHELDDEAMKTWVYPTNLGSTRDYQFNITQRGLYHNLLVALPTGLGKTFIAATVMLNWYRWTRNSQIVFVAPTKPLVAQQVEACFHVVGIPRSDTTMLTGNIQPALRAQEWLEKRVFFMTPQTLLHDLASGICDPKKIVLLVVDEAHRATGNYAYVEVVRFLRRFNNSFRVLALTATPGSSVETVQNVIDGLGISRVEIRTEESLDIREYVHRRNIEIETFDYSDEVTMVMDLFSKALQPILNKLNSQNAHWAKDPMSLTTYGLTKSRQQWMASEAGRKASFGLKGMVQGIFSLLAGRAHSIELLKYHGIGPFFRNVNSFQTETFENKKGSKYAKEICNNEHFKKMMTRLQAWINNPDFVGHPKLSFLKQVVLNHFLDAGAGVGAAGGRPPSDTRIMVFVHYRDSAEEVTRILKRHEPMIRPRVFVGQAGSKGSEGMDQKTQLDIIEKFKAGFYNTIVATSIGEEGLDIGEVDLIVCYDSSASPIRMLQRMGRTGRKRAGNIYLLLMKGKEEDSYMKAKDNYEKMQTMIADGSRFVFHDNLSPRMVPKDIQPVVDKRVIEIPLENTQSTLPEPRKGRKGAKKPPKKFHMPDGVIDGFVKATRLNQNNHGSGDEGKHRRSQISKERPPPPAPLPPLDKVLLTSDQEAHLEERYRQVPGDSPQFIRAPDLDAFPTFQRAHSKTAQVPHSRSAATLTRALTAISSFADKPRPLHDPDIFSTPSKHSALFFSASESDPESTILGTAKSPSLLSLRTLDESPLRPPSRRRQQNTINNRSAAGSDMSSKKFPLIDKESRFYVSQESKADSDTDADEGEAELPDMSELLGDRRGMSAEEDKENGMAAVTAVSRSGPQNRPSRGRKRRLVLDDDDDDNE